MEAVTALADMAPISVYRCRQSVTRIHSSSESSSCANDQGPVRPALCSTQTAVQTAERHPNKPLRLYITQRAAPEECSQQLQRTAQARCAFLLAVLSLASPCAAAAARAGAAGSHGGPVDAARAGDAADPVAAGGRGAARGDRGATGEQLAAPRRARLPLLHLVQRSAQCLADAGAGAGLQLPAQGPWMNLTSEGSPRSGRNRPARLLPPPNRARTEPNRTQGGIRTGDPSVLARDLQQKLAELQVRPLAHMTYLPVVAPLAHVWAHRGGAAAASCCRRRAWRHHNDLKVVRPRCSRPALLPTPRRAADQPGAGQHVADAGRAAGGVAHRRVEAVSARGRRDRLKIVRQRSATAPCSP